MKKILFEGLNFDLRDNFNFNNITITGVPNLAFCDQFIVIYQISKYALESN